MKKYGLLQFVIFAFLPGCRYMPFDGKILYPIRFVNSESEIICLKTYDKYYDHEDSYREKRKWSDFSCINPTKEDVYDVSDESTTSFPEIFEFYDKKKKLMYRYSKDEIVRLKKEAGYKLSDLNVLFLVKNKGVIVAPDKTPKK